MKNHEYGSPEEAAAALGFRLRDCGEYTHKWQVVEARQIAGDRYLALMICPECEQWKEADVTRWQDRYEREGLSRP